jgi:hypothetical protein
MRLRWSRWSTQQLADIRSYIREHDVDAAKCVRRQGGLTPGGMRRSWLQGE